MFKGRPEAADPAPDSAPSEPAPAPVVLYDQRYFYLGPDLALARLDDGHFIYVDPADEAVAAHLIARGYWERWITDALARMVRPGDRVVEVGANFGYHSLAMARAVGAEGRLTAFEANPRLASLLGKTLRFNGYADRASVFAKAAADVAGGRNLIVSRRNAGGGALSDDAGAMGDDGELIRVDSVTLDEAVEGPVDLIRMDAEGSEPLILKGASRLLARDEVVVVMEWDVVQMAARCDVPHFAASLAGQGFRFWKIDYDSALVEVATSDMQTLTGHDVVLSRHPLEAVA